jgi:insertion element IS1 protein InsB
MTKCYKSVGGLFCNCCNSPIIKHGLVKGRQRYRCKTCNKTRMGRYTNNACSLAINAHIVNHLKEGCGIRSIARLLEISAVTVLSRIKSIASQIQKPIISMGRIYEVDELKTYIKNKGRDY